MSEILERYRCESTGAYCAPDCQRPGCPAKLWANLPAALTEPEAMFKVLKSFEHGLPADCPDAIPWRLIAPHEAQAIRNHSQTLRRLNERGGLSPRELWVVLNNRPLRDYSQVTQEDAVEYLKALVAGGGGR